MSYPRLQDLPNGGEMKSPEGAKNGGRKTTSGKKKQGHSPTVSWRIQNPEGFYSEDRNEVQQETHEWQVPDKWQRLSQMVFCGGV